MGFAVQSSLNPFDIRGIRSNKQYSPSTPAMTLSLNPFDIRAFVQTQAVDVRAHKAWGLNPFDIRAFVQTNKNGDIEVWGEGLNPFDIRAFVQTAFTKERYEVWQTS